MGGRGVCLWHDATPGAGTLLGKRGHPSPRQSPPTAPHMPQAVQGSREAAAGSSSSTSATRQTHTLRPRQASALAYLSHPLFDEGSFVFSPSPTLGCSLGGFTALVPKYLAVGMAPLACCPGKGHPDLPAHQAGSSGMKRQYTSLPVRPQLILRHWFVSSLVVPHSTMKTRKQAECGK